MTFIEVYSRIIPLWGIDLDFSDGVHISTNDEFGYVHSEEKGFYSKQLSEVWNNVENSIPKNDVFAELMVWTMFQIFHKYAKELFIQGISTLKPNSVSKSEIEEQYFVNLNEQGWSDELSVYQRVID